MTKTTVRTDDGSPDLIIGRNLTEVARVARNDMGWQRLSTRRWLDRDYREIVYLSSADLLDAFEDGSVVYLAPGVTERDDWYEFEAALLTHRSKTVEL